VIAIIVLGYIRFLYKELFVLSFDPEYSKVSGINARFIQMFFMIITALVIGASMRIVGILLVSSLMTVPVAAAMQIAKSFKSAMIYSIIFGEISVIIGLFSAYHLDIAPGGTIVVTSILLLLIVLAWKKVRGDRKTVSVEGELV
jgi:zinc transport system permease protein